MSNLPYRPSSHQGRFFFVFVAALSLSHWVTRYGKANANATNAPANLSTFSANQGLDTQRASKCQYAQTESPQAGILPIGQIIAGSIL
jgi:hypothetical protein